MDGTARRGHHCLDASVLMPASFTENVRAFLECGNDSEEVLICVE